MNWPKDLPLPTREQAEEAAREIERAIREAAARRRGKLLHSDPEMLTTQITI